MQNHVHADPVGQAIVSLQRPGQPPTRRQVTGDGFFVFRDLEPGLVGLTAVADGYIKSGPGQSAPGGASRETHVERSRSAPVIIRLWPEAVIVGSVVDEVGEPMPQVPVVLTARNGDGTLASDRYDTRLRATTDDRGAFRFGRLMPGEYLVSVPGQVPVLPIGSVVVPDPVGSSASVRPASDQFGYPTTFHPGARTPASATPLRLEAGGLVQALVQAVPVPVVPVSGVVMGPSGPEPDVTVSLFPSYAVGRDLEFTHAAATTTSRADGTFVLSGVPTGSYQLRAWRVPGSLSIGSDPLPAEPSLWASVTVDVGDSPRSDLVVGLQPGVRLRGQLRFDGDGAPPLEEAGRRRVQPMLGVIFQPRWPAAINRRLSARVSSTGAFETEPVPPGVYPVFRPTALALRDWHLDAVNVNGAPLWPSPLVVDGSRDIDGIELAFSDRPTGLEGTVVDVAGEPDSAAAVMLVPFDYRRWLSEGTFDGVARMALTADDGSWAIPDVIPGEYFLGALPDGATTRWPDLADIDVAAAFSTRIFVRSGNVTRHALTSR